MFVIFLLDRLTKIEIIKEVNSNPFYINDYINLDLIWNTGIGFGLLSSDSSLIYNFITLIIGLVILVLIYLSFTSEKIEKIIYSIIIGGALGIFMTDVIIMQFLILLIFIIIPFTGLLLMWLIYL